MSWMNRDEDGEEFRGTRITVTNDIEGEMQARVRRNKGLKRRPPPPERVAQREAELENLERKTVMEWLRGFFRR